MSLSTGQLRTPARVFSVSESQTAFGGIVRSRTLIGVVWGDFRPAPAREVSGTEGEVSLRQAAVFLCRAGEGLERGQVLDIHNRDWNVVSVDVLADAVLRAQIEQVPQ